MDIEKPKIEQLYGHTAEEHKFAVFAYRLMQGVDVNDHWLQIAKLNTPDKKVDNSIYEVDFGILEDSDIIGYIDLETKTQWKSGEWIYPRTNIALYPMQHWQRGNFNGNHTVKLQRFSQKPKMSYWIGVRADYGALWIVPFVNLAEYGVKTTQQTRYSEIPLPVIIIDNSYCTYCADADTFTEFIIEQYKRNNDDRHCNF